MVTVTGSKNVFGLAICCEIFSKETKSKYVVQLGLAPFVKDELITNIQKTSYSFKFDETTNSQVKKAV